MVRTKKLGVTLSAAFAAVALTFGAASPALAAQFISGNRACPGGAQAVGLQSTSTGPGYHLFKSSTTGAVQVYEYSYSGYWSTGSNYTSAYWEGYSTGTISGSSYCY